jgi:acyl dehydratase
MKYFEDFNVGDRMDIGSHRFTADEIKLFAAQFDPQPFHIDEAAAAQSHFGALCASGWHTASMWMRLRILYGQREDAERTARGEPNAALGPSPGFREMRWLKPVYAGDTISYASEVADKRASQSRPGWGLIQVHNTGTNQNGELVISFKSSAFVERRPDAVSFNGSVNGP